MKDIRCLVGVHDWENIEGSVEVEYGNVCVFNSICLRCGKRRNHADKLRAKKAAREARRQEAIDMWFSS